MKSFLLQALKEIRNQKARSFFTAFGVFLGSLSLMLFYSLGDYTHKNISAELKETGLLGLQIYCKTGELTPSDLSLLTSLPQVTTASPVLANYGAVKAAGKTADCIIWATTRGNDQVFPLHLLYGRLFSEQDMQDECHGCLVDQNFASAYYKRKNIVGKTLSVNINGKQEPYTVIGVVASGGALTQGILGSFVPHFVYLPWPTMMAQGNISGFSQLAVSLDESKDRQKAITQTLDALSAHSEINGIYTAEDLQENSDRIDTLLNDLSLVLLLMGSLALCAAGCTVFLMMQSAVRERRAEIATRKALGTSKGQIMLLFLCEASLLSLIGGISGFALQFPILALLSKLLGLPLPTFQPTLFLFLPGVVLFGGLCGLLPAKSAADCEPAIAFRSL